MNAQQIAQLISKSSVTFAGIEYETQIKTAAKHKQLNITKRTKANVQVFGTVKEFTNVYKNAVMRSASKAGTPIDNFEVSDNYFTHTDCYSIVEHKTNGKEYLYCIYNNADSEYFIDGMQVIKADVMQYLTPSALKAMQEKRVTNKTNDVEHDVVVRTIAVDNIKSFTANKVTIN
jgi:hypothetical protein